MLNVKAVIKACMIICALFVFNASFLLFAPMASEAAPQDEDALGKDASIKAAFLYNFAKFVDWPAQNFRGTDERLLICTLGDASFSAALELLNNKTVKERKVWISRLKDVSEASECEVLFIGLSERNSLHEILPQLKGKSILTVSEIENFTTRGGMVGIFLRNSKVRFKINLDLAQRSRLKISSYLLEISDIQREN